MISVEFDVDCVALVAVLESSRELVLRTEYEYFRLQVSQSFEKFSTRTRMHSYYSRLIRDYLSTLR
jgi:hypothetical protein